jgi:hypothetical protein
MSLSDFQNTKAGSSPRFGGQSSPEIAVFRHGPAFLLVMTLIASDMAAAEIKTPEAVYAGRPSNLEQLPAGWVSDRPIELVVSFNLTSEPNSAEANAFLRNWYQSISALPYDVDLEMKRFLAPATYTYAASLRFNNWAEYREYETSDDFLRYYYEQWKPLVASAEERVYVLEPALD